MEKTKLAKEINEKLHNGIVKFKFRKKNGKIREALGTLCKKAMENYDVNEPNGNSSPNVQVYFDLERESFRSFKLGTELEIMEFLKVN